jgi:DNA-binding transcriptional ArsR family regulator
MAKLSLKDRLKAYLDKKGEWVNGGQLEALAMQAGYKASNASRRMRELYEDGLVERQMQGKSVAYKTLSPKTKRVLTRTHPITGEKEIIKVIYE